MKDIIRKLKEQKFITKVGVSEDNYKDDITQTGDPDEIIKYVERPKYPITKESNSALMYIMHNSGLAASEDFMTWDEVEAVTDEDIKNKKSTLFPGGPTIPISFFAAPFGDSSFPTLEYFNEFKYFTNVTMVSNEISPYVTLPRSLKEVTFPKSCINISISGIDQRNLSKLIIDPENPKYDSRNDCNAIIDTETNTLIIGTASTIIPDSVTSIGESAFSECTNLNNITIPDSVTSIGDSAFKVCDSLTSITIPDSVTSIGDSAFDSCTNLNNITIPDSVTSIGDSAFEGCANLSNIKLSDNITELQPDTFKYCHSLKTIIIPDSVTEIIGGVFWDSGLESITIPANVTSMSAAFKDCRKLSTIISLAPVAGELNGSYTDVDNMGADVEGEKILQVPKNATGYNSYPWSAFAAAGYTLKYIEE